MSSVDTKGFMKAFFYPAFIFTTIMFYLFAKETEKPFFQAKKQAPYHLSVGAVLFNQEGKIACHHFTEIGGLENIYILMRETMENEETPLMTLHRGLMEEFGATCQPIAFIGDLSAYIPSEKRLSFYKTTLYVVCRLKDWDPKKRKADDPEASSNIEWMEPNKLISLMRIQGERLHSADLDESEIVKRAIPYLNHIANPSN